MHMRKKRRVDVDYVVESVAPGSARNCFRDIVEPSDVELVGNNGLAHTYLKGPAATMAIDAPSVTKARFNDIYNGLRSFDHGLRLL
jgi:hypothetical protein